jgi:hypothetical protein
MHIGQRIGRLCLSAVLLWEAPFQFDQVSASDTEEDLKGDSPALTFITSNLLSYVRSCRSICVQV